MQHGRVSLSFENKSRSEQELRHLVVDVPSVEFLNIKVQAPNSTIAGRDGVDSLHVILANAPVLFFLPDYFLFLCTSSNSLSTLSFLPLFSSHSLPPSMLPYCLPSLPPFLRGRGSAYADRSGVSPTFLRVRPLHRQLHHSHTGKALVRSHGTYSIF